MLLKVLARLSCFVSTFFYLFNMGVVNTGSHHHVGRRRGSVQGGIYKRLFMLLVHFRRVLNENLTIYMVFVSLRGVTTYHRGQLYNTHAQCSGRGHGGCATSVLRFTMRGPVQHGRRHHPIPQRLLFFLLRFVRL